MRPNQPVTISQAGLQLAIQEIKDELFDTPECDYTIARLLSHCGKIEEAERYLDEMLMKWGYSPEILSLTNKGYADIAALNSSATATLRQATQPAPAA